MKIPANLSEPDWGALGKIVYDRSYSRIKEDGEREDWAETVKRVVDGNMSFVDEKYIEPYEKVKLFHMIYNFQFIPAGRHLWATGVEGAEYVSNCFACGFDPHDFSRHFTYTFERLMEGGGVGSSYSNTYVRNYPTVPKTVEAHIVCDETHDDYDKMEFLLSTEYSSQWAGCYEVNDSREGWANALGVLLDSYYNGEDRIVIDVSHIRPSGARLKTFGGTASGPKALAEMLLNISEIINNHKGLVPDSELCMDIDHEIAKAVIAGGTRRSARMASKYWNDPDIFDFVNLKEDGESHWTANLSIEVDTAFWDAVREGEDKATELLKKIVEGIHTNGEPGFINLTKAAEGEIHNPFSTNPCGEIVGVVNPNTDIEGLMACNLGSLNLDKLADDEPKLKEACRLGARFLLRATYADYPDEELQEVVQEERRIGMGIMGFHPFLLKNNCKYTEFPHNDSIKNKMRNYYEVVRESARDYAFHLRIPEPVKVTTSAPTGTSSKLTGTTPGIQPIEHKYFIRRVRYTLIDSDKRDKVEELEAAGFNVIWDVPREPDTAIVEFPLKAPDLSEIDESMVETVDDISIEQMMEVQAALQDVWADNSISVTISFDQDEVGKERIESALKAYVPRLKGVTLFPEVSNIDLSPIEGISKEEFMEYPEHLRQEANAAGECVTGSCEFDPSNIQGE